MAEKQFKWPRAKQRVQLICEEGSSKAKNSFKLECDINNIMARYNRTGQLPEMIKTDPQYGDYSEAPDFQEASNIVIKAREQFEALPAKVRERFQNSPETFLAFATDKSNREEMGRMGLLNENAMADLLKARNAKALEDAEKLVAEKGSASKRKPPVVTGGSASEARQSEA